MDTLLSMELPAAQLIGLTRKHKKRKKAKRFQELPILQTNGQVKFKSVEIALVRLIRVFYM